MNSKKMTLFFTKVERIENLGLGEIFYAPTVDRFFLVTSEGYLNLDDYILYTSLEKIESTVYITDENYHFKCVIPKKTQ